VSWWERWRADLRRPERASADEERGFLIGCPIVVVAIAQLTDPGDAVDLAVMAVAVAGYVLRAMVSRLPAEVFAALVLVPVVVVVGGGAMEPTLFLVVTMVLFVAASLGSLTRALVILAFAVTLPWAVASQLAPEEEIGWATWGTASAFTFLLGRLLRRQGLLITELAHAQSALADQAVAEERRRIARELHDLAGHTLAAVLLHVTGARHVLRRDLDEAERALIDAETVGRSSLDQIRATVAALRTDERGTDPALAGAADLSSLVEEYRRAGLDVELAVSGDAATLDGPLGTAVHRIAREALANVARHAPANRAQVRLQVGDGRLELSVVDHGTPASDPDGGGHFGIIGMRERARALGGDLDAGPTAEGWAVAAHLPLPAGGRAAVPT